MPWPHIWVSFCEHTPSPVHAPQSDHVAVASLQVRVCVPHLPQGCCAAPGQGCVEHAPHVQVPPQVRVPPVPHASLVPAVQASAGSSQVDQAPHMPLAQVRRLVPHLPHVSVGGPSQTWLSQLPQLQSPPHICWPVPLAPHIIDMSGMHAPSSVQADHTDHKPF